jgi:glycosyltransferase involved in cell wall biosynthesis
MSSLIADGSAEENAGKAESLRCLIVVASLIRAGAETQAVDLANGLAAEGHEVHLCSFESQLDQLDRVSRKVQFHHVPRKSKYDRSLVRRLSALIDEHQIQVTQGVLQFATLIIWLASLRSSCRPPVIGAIHTTVNRGLKQEILDRLVYRNMLRRLSKVVFVCDQQRNHWIRRYPELRRTSRVVHNGVKPELFSREEFVEAGRGLRKELGIPADAIVFSCIAAFRPEKGHKLLLEAYQPIMHQAYLVFAGDGALQNDMKEYAASLGMSGTTRFLGSIPDTRILIATSSTTVLASTAVETFSMAMLESMAMGVPMIAPRIGGLSEAIIHGETGLLFPVGSAVELKKCLRSVVEDPSYASTMGAHAMRKVREEFTFAKMVKSTEHVMQDVLNRADVA